MDDNIIYYLVLGAIYLVSKVLKKKKPVVPIESDRKNKEESEGPSPPISFKSLVEEISQEHKNSQEEERNTTELNELPPPPKKPVFEKNKYISSAEESIRKDNTRVLQKEELKKEAFAMSEDESYARLLHEDRGVENAIILSEILNRKY